MESKSVVPKEKEKVKEKKERKRKEKKVKSYIMTVERKEVEVKWD